MPPKNSATGKRKNLEKPTPVDEKFAQVDVSTSNPKTVLLLLESPEPVIVCKACDALHNYIQNSDQRVMEVVEIGGVSFITKLLSSSERAARCHAILCLSVMVQQVTVRLMLIKMDTFIPAMLKLLQLDEELLTQEKASYTLTLLADDYSFKIALGNNDAHKPLLALVQTTDPDIQKNSIKILSQMMEHFPLRSKLLDDEGLGVVVNLLESEYATIQDLALHTLRSCMHHTPSREKVSTGEDLPKLVAFLGDKKNSDLHVFGVEVLGLCLSGLNSISLLQSSGCLHNLLTYISDSNDPVMKKNATNTLASGASDELNRKLLHESQSEKIFVNFLSSEDNGLVEAACGILRKMSQLKSSQQVIGVEGGVADVAKLLIKEDSVRCAALHCLVSLLEDCPTNCKYLADSNGQLETLVPLLSDQLALCRQLASDCIINISCNENIRQRLFQSGVVMALVGCFSFQDQLVQASSVRALGMLATDQMAREQLCSGGGLESLISLLQSSSKDVLKCAIWTLTVCAQSTDVAEEAGRLGAIEQLKTVESCEDNYCSSLAQSALKRILDANLPAKYWIKGSLDVTDIIVNMEFFDGGPGLSKQPFISLPDLAQLPLTKNRPVITVNLISKHINVSSEDHLSVDTGTSTLSAASGINTRGKSRQQLASRSKRRGPDRDAESRISAEESEVVSEESKPPLVTRVLEVDPGLNLHLKHVQKNIKPLTSIKDQVEQLAKYISSSLGGAVERSGPFCYELSASQIQSEQQSNLVPIGELQQGSFQHRALLFKVLCDSVGIPCSLERGDYGRHWNEVCLKESGNRSGHIAYLVDLMFHPGLLYLSHSTLAAQYQHV